MPAKPNALLQFDYDYTTSQIQCQLLNENFHKISGNPSYKRLEVKTYRDYLKYVADPTAENAEPTMFARRHGKLYLWPVPDGVYTVNVDYASYHPEAFEEILFGPEFNEAITSSV